jgi:site-specific DNA recombinase
MTRSAALYARYSSNLQRPTSIEDQLALCRSVAARWQLSIAETHLYIDREQPGSSSQRPGYQALLEAAKHGAFEAIVVEAQDRLWRDQGEMYRALQLLRFWGISVYSVETGLDLTDKAGKITATILGLRDETYLDSLREKTHRGMLGQIMRGFSAGGRPFGYRTVPIIDHTRKDRYGNPFVVGHQRVVDASEAAIVREIFEQYAAGLSPKTIARALNDRKVAAPRPRVGVAPRGWTWTTINGCPKKAIGILNNPIYIGQVYWNRSYKVRDPESGRRVTRYRDPSEWVVADIPELRIVSDDLWQIVQRRRADQREVYAHLGRTRPRAQRHPFGGLLVCGVCGGPYVIKTRGYYGCANNINRGKRICPNTRLVRRDVLEGAVADFIRRKVYGPKEIDVLVRLVNDRLAALASERTSTGSDTKEELTKARHELENIKQAIRDGVRTPTTLQMLQEVEGRITRLERKAQPAPAAPKPITREGIQHYVGRLKELLVADVEGAKRLLKTLIQPITLEPAEDGTRATLRGNLEGVLMLAWGRSDVRYWEFGARRGI